MSQTCEVKRIQQNSAQAVVDQAQQAYNQTKSEYHACLGPQALGDAAVEDAKPAMDKIFKEAETILYMEQFLLGHMRREATNGSTVGLLKENIHEESSRLQKEIDEIKGEIRTEKRRFTDANPTASTAVAGLYFTMQPDNQILIVFLSCFGAFLLFTGLLVLMNHVPIYAIQALTMGDRLKLVGSAWILAVIMMYVGFFTFT